MNKTLRLFIICCLFAIRINAQSTVCDTSTQLHVILTVRTDKFGEETGWVLKGGDGTLYAAQSAGPLADYTIYSDTFCMTKGFCDTLIMKDSYGDGMNDAAPNQTPGWYILVVDGDTLANGSVFGYKEITVFDCAPLQTCSSAEPIGIGTYNAPMNNSWYEFTPDSTGYYDISTCGLGNVCNTIIWIYDNCNNASINNTNAGTVYYNDNSDLDSCGNLAIIYNIMQAGKTYYIRIGGSDCSENIAFSISFNGPVTGCTDPLSCNFNPQATIDDGSCIPTGSLECPEAPDLLMVESALINSLEKDIINNTDGCLVSEGCLNGFGMRKLVRFDTHIKNIGDLDYFIGTPTATSDQFTFDNCHNHYHYEGYAEYLLFDSTGNEIPIGFKNGFCVLDLECSDGGNAQYSCNYMGISKDCGDVYDSYLDCQWIDVTTLPSGKYLLVTRVNWDNSPDALGHVEKNMNNNWAQACLDIQHTSDSDFTYTVDPNCPTYVDCTGAPFGNAQVDCNGVCGGNAPKGDIDDNGLADMIDAQQYVNKILANDIPNTPCYDLSGDAQIDVYDAELLASCLNFGAAHVHPGAGFHNHCKFPAGIVQFQDTVSLRISDFDLDAQTIDIAIKNPTASVVGYQFQMSGIKLQSATNLVDATTYPITPQGNIDAAMVIGVSFQDSTIEKSEEWQPLVRLHYLETTANEICIDNIITIINKDDHEVTTKIDGECLQVTATQNIASGMNVRVLPNPFNDYTRITFNNPQAQSHTLLIQDLSGRIVQQYHNVTSEEVVLQSRGMARGMYVYQLISPQGVASGKLVVQ